MPSGDRNFGTVSSILLAAAGLALAAGGAGPLTRIVKTADLVAIGTGATGDGADLSRTELRATADRLEAASARARTADEAGALTFLFYAAAQASWRAGDAAASESEIAAARKAAVETLSKAPTRADVALALAWIELAAGKERQALDAPLLLSYETAPRELWIIECRIWLGLRLAATATPELRAHIVNDIRTMGQPFRSANLYLELAQAARASGLYAITLVRHELAAIDNQPLQAFNIYLAELDAEAAGKKR
jgi:hypothetical protein